MWRGGSAIRQPWLRPRGLIVIYTVFSTSPNPAMQWQSELLEYSWGQVKQPGELVRLVATWPGDELPRHRLARVVETSSWSPHPFTGDWYPQYNKPASLLEWLFTEGVEGTVLLLEPDCVFRSAVTTEVEPGKALATPWPGMPSESEGPFGLGPSFSFLEQFCVNRSLVPPPVHLPLLIHSTDLRKIVARWLELASIIRTERVMEYGRFLDANDVAYAVAAAEAYIPHATAELGVETDVGESRAPIIHYRRPIESERGEIVWDKQAYRCWDPVEAQRANAGIGRDFLELLTTYIALHEAGGEFAFFRPCRRRGVREGRVLDQTLLEIPGRSDTLSLNPSATAIWQLCDGKHSMADLTRKLEVRYEVERGRLRDDVGSVITRLESIGAVELRSM